MTGEKIYELTTELLGGSAMSETLFASFLNMAKEAREGAIEWAVLRTKGTTLQYSPSKTPITLPTNFSKFVKQTAKTNPVVFIENGLKVGTAREILINQEYENTNDNCFYVEYNGDSASMVFVGGPDKNLDFVPYYIRKTDTMDENNYKTWTWAPFPGEYAKLLAFDVANIVKGDIDYDDINARQVSFSKEDARVLERAMKLWDQRMKLSALQV